MNDQDVLGTWRSNPFFVLEVDLQASRAEVERAGQRLLGLLAIGSAGIERYQTPFGPAIRDADMVRQALAVLRDPQERVFQELWASIIGRLDDRVETKGWDGAGAATGWTKIWGR
jgi:hypothetical protein